MAAGITAQDKVEWIRQRAATTLVISSKLVIWSAHFHLLIIDKGDHIWANFPLLVHSDSTGFSARPHSVADGDGESLKVGGAGGGGGGGLRCQHKKSGNPICQESH